LRVKKGVAGFGVGAYKAPPDANGAAAVHETATGGGGGKPDKPALTARASSGDRVDGRFDLRRDHGQVYTVL